MYLVDFIEYIVNRYISFRLTIRRPPRLPSYNIVKKRIPIFNGRITRSGDMYERMYRRIQTYVSILKRRDGKDVPRQKEDFMSFQRCQYYPRVSSRTSLSRHTRFVLLEKYLFDHDGKEKSPYTYDRRTEYKPCSVAICACIGGPFWASPGTRSLNPLGATREHGLGGPRMTLGMR